LYITEHNGDDSPKEFVSDTVSYIVLRGRWCDVIVLKARSLIKDKNHHSKSGFCEESEQEFIHFPQCHMQTMFGDLSARFLREGILKLVIGNESLHEDSKDNGVGIENFVK